MENLDEAIWTPELYLNWVSLGISLLHTTNVTVSISVTSSELFMYFMLTATWKVLYCLTCSTATSEMWLLEWGAKEKADVREEKTKKYEYDRTLILN